MAGPPKDQMRVLTVSEYLRGLGINDQAARRLYSPFGRLVKRKYMTAYGRPPATGTRYVHGVPIHVCLYRERDRGLFDLAWAELRHGFRVTF